VIERDSQKEVALTGDAKWRRPLEHPAIDTSGLVKVFGRTRAVDRVDLSVPAGSVYAILGPNGAGKTTVIRMLATLLTPDEGAAHVLGHDVVREAAAVRRAISLTGQFSSVDQDLTGKENLVLVGRLLGYTRGQAKARAGELLAAFGLAGTEGRRVATYSGGMRRRLDIAASILVPPAVLFLDEPTTGLDPRGRIEVWETVAEFVAGGTTVLLTTQYLEEADRLADRIAVIDRGRVIAEGTSDELKASVGTAILGVRLTDADRRSEAERVLAEALGTPCIVTSNQHRCPRRWGIRRSRPGESVDSTMPASPLSTSTSNARAWTKSSWLRFVPGLHVRRAPPPRRLPSPGGGSLR
jgi:daunorubicin/doxorubicin transport system ATP-binding protein